MESFFLYLCENAYHATWIFFLLLLLTGLSLPISEDLLLLLAGAIASSCIPQHSIEMYVWVFLGSILSAWEAYWIGRLLGPKLYRFRLFQYILTAKRLESLRYYYAKYGILTFIVGRFCPGGVRNALFLTSGLTKMPFHLFVLRDGLACFISTMIFFHIGYQIGQHLDLIRTYYRHYEHIVLGIVLFVTLGGLIYFWYTHSFKKRSKDAQK